jgi:4-alpha-glucanotransferase
MNLRSEALRLGIELDYLDALGRRRQVPDEAIAKIVQALGTGSGVATAPLLKGDQDPAPSGPPQQAYQGPAGRWWLLAAQLYGIRSRRNWGHGDFSDLLALVELAADVGAAGIGINPLHALLDDRMDEPSPYSPSSRLFLNPLYIDVDAIPDHDGARTAEVDAAIERLHHSELVDHAGVAALKQECLRVAYRAFGRHAASERRDDFEAFRQSRHPTLARYAAFEVLRRRLPGPWWDWSAEWQGQQDKRDEAFLRLRAQAGDEMGFYEYVQWIADRQLMRCRDRAGELGLPIGLYLDVAVGVRADGFDSWDAPDTIVRTLAVGAPPDLLNAVGQNWGLAGFSGVGLQARAFRPFRDMLRASMRYAGAIRLDHAFGLKRLYFIPAGLPPDQGAYVRMPFRQLLQVTAEESAANGCIVVGEDLGTVPERFREQVAPFGIWSYQVMLFERGETGAFWPPAHYAERALVTFSTHDLPTFAGWLFRHDLRVRENLEIPAGETEDERARAIAALRKALRARGLMSADFASVVRYLAASPARLLAIALEDVLELRDQPNIPGTIDVHPNWRRKLPVELERLRDHALLGEVARVAADVGRSAVAVPSPATR